MNVFPGRDFNRNVYGFDRISYMGDYMKASDIDIERWKNLTLHQKKYYVDKGYLNFAFEVTSNMFDETPDPNPPEIDMVEANARAKFALTNLPVQDLDPDRTAYTKIGKAVAQQKIKNSYRRFNLPNLDNLVGAIAMSYPYSDFYSYDVDFPAELLGPDEEYVDYYPPLLT